MGSFNRYLNRGYNICFREKVRQAILFGKISMQFPNAKNPDLGSGCSPVYRGDSLVAWLGLMLQY